MTKKRKSLEHNSECPLPKGVLIAIGGKENKGQAPDHDSNQINNENFIPLGILDCFKAELKKDNPLIAIIPTASSLPKESAQDYVQAFKKLGLNNVSVIDIRCREDATKAEYLQAVEQADGIMFTGGDQLRLTAILGGTEFLNILKYRYTYDTITIAGTSAGAMAMSTPMIYEGPTNGGGFLKGEVRITTGLEFLKDVAIDTHFIARGRMVRMTQAIATNPGCIGIGLEEDTGIIVRDGRNIEVIGSGLIVIVDGHLSTETNVHLVDTGAPVTMRNLLVHMLGAGDRYEINIADSYHK
ncbi:cyanophycinase [Adhaeribacter pallidiroseus]|uniref:Cyanophycinase n=1 Tax=Adhaeribacter pallidiroseus TaxID=2072847 RepID=A0A369QJR6_9BACT|nr:cyanophycinase [Adhaeribacter pallidiroseus]RDC63487.1 Cyanophycinase [Adhaeribacter pallidiroseus]